MFARIPQYSMNYSKLTDEYYDKRWYNILDRLASCWVEEGKREQEDVSQFKGQRVCRHDQENIWALYGNTMISRVSTCAQFYLSFSQLKGQ